jgi:hypothetical protein
MAERPPLTPASLSDLYGLASRAPAGLLEFLRDRGDLWPSEAALCIAVWSFQEGGRSCITPREIQAIASRPEVRALVPRLRTPAAALRSCADSGLVEAVVANDLSDGPGPGRPARRDRRVARGPWYRVTPLGLATVAALPDRRRAAELRGLGTAVRAGLPGPSRRATPGG